MTLSHSRVNRYDFCPRSYRYYYIDGWRPKTKKPALLFGDAVDQALQAFFRAGEDPASAFEGVWEKLKDSPVAWGKRNTWEGFLEIGKRLLERFLAEEASRFSEVAPENVQRRLTADLEGLTVIGYPDLYCKVDGLLTLVDFKTAASPYDTEEVALNEQLTAYWWLLSASGLPVERVAFCVLLKLKEPKIGWHFSTRSEGEVAEYLEKLRIVAADVERGRFPRKSASCGFMGGCDFKPLCLGNEEKIQMTLCLPKEISEEEIVI
ncbi:RecB family exonuclease [Candidatus Manganitrophus noduliformans]|uniref:PD-(D/E)XK nuclease family protein n=1 Tax=Candidatus Manganitrophus noduliformans TaxID=2606439 RepID=A0A7X6DT31_9BACT|nr:PD-(D/E)XK nuclease family protein [Candidatus Manganitrophus noduliformans]NKE72872.1 PD-(D/E)XK nuclease family protein [Candidatus Manganitrophus noduliformans]